MKPTPNRRPAPHFAATSSPECFRLLAKWRAPAGCVGSGKSHVVPVIKARRKQYLPRSHNIRCDVWNGGAQRRYSDTQPLSNLSKPRLPFALGVMPIR